MARPASNTILPENQPVTLSDLRRRPARYFQPGTVTVTKRGETIGYLLSPEQFEFGLELLARSEDPAVLKERLQLSDFWLEGVRSKRRK